MEEMPIQMLKKDHQKVEELMSGCKNTVDPKERAEILNKIVKELEIHMQVEEELFYPLVSGVSDEGEQLIRHGKREHDELREIILSFKDMDEYSDEYEEDLKKMEVVKNDHIREEEQRVFPFAEKNLEDEMGITLSTKMMALKQKLKLEK